MRKAAGFVAPARNNEFGGIFMKLAVTFPGQGSQAVGMGKALAAASPIARAVFEEVDEALGQDLSTLMWDGPEETLTLTENTQPALMTMSVAVSRVLEKEGGFALGEKASFVAGHSLGEYSALAAAGAITLADTARLLKIRGQAMQKAVPVGEGAMAALLGLDMVAAQDVVKNASNGEVCETANDNAPGQVVISGSKAAVERAAELAIEAGAKKAMLLQVSAPFHCSLMQPAAEVMAAALLDAEIKVPSVPLVANVTALPVSDPDEIRDLLVKQVTGMVRWREVVSFMAEQGVEQIIEAGSGRVLSTLMKRIDRSVTPVNLSTIEQIHTYLETL